MTDTAHVEAHLARLQALDSNTVSDALDFFGLPGATFGIRPLWNCPRIVGRASTLQFAPKTGGGATVHPITPVIAASKGCDRILVIAGGLEGISCWGDIVANAAKAKGIRGTVIDGCSRDIEGSEAIGYPVYGRGITMISARNRAVQVSSGEPGHDGWRAGGAGTTMSSPTAAARSSCPPRALGKCWTWASASRAARTAWCRRSSPDAPSRR
ncbi:protein DlpA [Alicycliphilus sp. B1]|nr:protein DlpA [Alicycliphilus sp. B1]